MPEEAAQAGELFHAADTSMEMLCLGMLILAAHLGGKLSRRMNLSDVTGQLLGGALVGPYILQLLGIIGNIHGNRYSDALHAFHFFIFIFLGMVAFGIGEELHISRLKKVGRTATIICLIQGSATWVFISTAFYLSGLFGLAENIGLLEALLIGSIGIATAPAVTFVLMNKLNIEGRLRHVLGSIVVLDDMIEVIIFSILIQLSLQKAKGSTGLEEVVFPVASEMLMAVLVGGGIFVILKILVRSRAISLEESHEKERQKALAKEAFLQRILAEHPSPSAEVLLVVMGTVALGAGLAYECHWPFLLTATFAGFLVANFHSHAIFDSLKIDNITPVMNLGFFALIGANIDLSGLEGGGAWLTLIYIATRMCGKIFGTWAGCKLMGEERKISACLPSLMLPQAGVAAVEAVYAGVVLGRPEITAIILPAIVFFEVVGVFLVDRGLRKWRTWVVDEENTIKEAKSKSGPAEAAKMLLGFLDPSHVNLHLNGKDKKTVIEELVDIARTCDKQHIDRVQALQVIGEREKLSPTGFGNGIAIPHCRLMGLDEPILVFGRHKSGIEFGGVDNSPSDLFLLILSSARNPGEHLKLLSAAAHILGDENTRKALREYSKPEEMTKHLTNIASGTAG